jgi:hypothetical protein
VVSPNITIFCSFLRTDNDVTDMAAHANIKKQQTKQKKNWSSGGGEKYFTWVPPPKPSLRPFFLKVGTIKIGYNAEQNPVRRTIVLINVVRKCVAGEEDLC